MSTRAKQTQPSKDNRHEVYQESYIMLSNFSCEVELRNERFGYVLFPI